MIKCYLIPDAARLYTGTSMTWCVFNLKMLHTQWWRDANRNFDPERFTTSYAQTLIGALQQLANNIKS